MADSNNALPAGNDNSELSAAIDSLKQAVSAPLDANDLGRLAQMHTGCQALTQADGPCGKLAAAVANLLEGIILKEAADADAGLAALPEAVGLMADCLAGADANIEPMIARINAAATGGPGSASGDTGAGDESTASSPAPEPVAAAAEPSPTAAAEPSPTAAADTPSTPTSQASAPSPAESEPAAAAGAASADAPEIEPYVAEPLVIDLDEKEHVEGFIDESGEHMDAIESALLEVEKDPTDTTKINELFRPFHTIKGIAGFLNLRDINRLTHEIETILDLGRKNELTITAEIIDLIFSGIDVLKEQIAEVANFIQNPTDGPVPQPDITDIMARLRTVAAGGSAPPAAHAPAGAAPAPAADSSVPAAPPAEASPTPAPAAAPVQPAASKPAAGGKPAGAKSGRSETHQVADTSIRVDTAKLDALVDAVGELVIAQTMVNLNEVIETSEKLARDVSQVTKIVRDVQETAMAMRMVPIGHTFGKMRRLVRDVSRKAGKQVELVINGEETELDKNVIQAISDPLVHMVRNAVDHGIEPPDVRRAAGKPETGTVSLNAYHRGDSIVIEIRDDGKGLDREKLLAKGIERGLVSPGEQLTDQQIYGLIFQPGFSTAEKITDISGRGVGMDVVKRNIEQLRGKVEITSELGRGSTFSIRLPLTLAIIDGMLVCVGGQRLIIPTIMIEQSLRPEPNQISVVQRKGTMIQVRGELIPLVQIGPLFNFCDLVDPTDGLVVIAQTEAHKIGIVVDELIGQQQVVIKTLGDRFKHVKGISGAAILGDGRVGLILEPTGLLTLHNERKLVFDYHESHGKREPDATPVASSASAASPEAGQSSQDDPAVDTTVATF